MYIFIDGLFIYICKDRVLVLCYINVMLYIVYILYGYYIIYNRENVLCIYLIDNIEVVADIYMCVSIYRYIHIYIYTCTDPFDSVSLENLTYKSSLLRKIQSKQYVSSGILVFSWLICLCKSLYFKDQQNKHILHHHPLPSLATAAATIHLSLSDFFLISPHFSLELRPLCQQSTKLYNRKQKFCSWNNRGDGRWCHSHFCPLILRLMNPGYGKSSIIFWKGNLEHI